MTRTLALLAAAALVVGLAGPADAQKLDAKGKCHDAKGKFASMSDCKPQTAESKHCREVKTKRFAKCGAPNTEAVPDKK